VSGLEVVTLAVAGFIAGVVNALAGGGTFFTFAVMVAFGMPALDANATSAVALVRAASRPVRPTGARSRPTGARSYRSR
jgi:uncharacterized membrane protein YfcA